MTLHTSASDADSQHENGHRADGNETGWVEPVAIVGMACRLPGEVGSPSQLWNLLVKGLSGQCDIPESRFNVGAFHHPDGADRPGSMNTMGGYFLKDDIRAFENSFFGINNLEATYMDPQQRKLLEVIFECFENAGTGIQEIAGTNTGCYIGNFTVDFQIMQTKDAEYLHRYSATGMGTTLLANRISHAFNLQGPSLVLDTACSSSLYCLHTAVMALRNRECDAAVVAGANLIQSPEQHLGTMKAGVLSGTSMCHTFDTSADGYGRADGVGALYVKRLSDAIRNGDPIRSVIRATAVNANGKTPGITLPSAAGQEAVIRKAYALAGLRLDETAYIECHGTGTPVGDPIEVEAIARAFKERSRDKPLLIGSIKTNLGHSEAASGISSIIKTTLALESGIVPSNVGVRAINPKIKEHEWNIEVVTDNTPWPGSISKGTVLRRAGVNSFGYGGANAHAILEAADSFVPVNYRNSPISIDALRLLNKVFLLPFSATSAKSLTSRVEAVHADHPNIADLAYTLSYRRSRLPIAGFILASQKDLDEDLQRTNVQTKSPTLNNRASSPFAFVFTGQGAQWAQMGKGLIDQFPTVRACIQRMDATLQALPHPPSWTLIDILTELPDFSKINEVTHSQPACTALQIALIDLLSYWNVVPQGVIGHSSGEIAAAYAAGLLTSAQAIIIAYYRGFIVGRSLATGQMMVVGLNQDDAHNEIKRLKLSSRVNVACVNSPQNVTISGDAEAIEDLHLALESRDVFKRKLLTGGRAYHSHHMASLGQEYETLIYEALKEFEFPATTQTEILFISSVTAEPLTQADAHYWRANLESPVLFMQALQALQSRRDFQLIEVGPHSALKLPILELRKHLGLLEADLPYFNALSRGENSAFSLLRLMGHLFITGVDVSFHRINSLDYTSKPAEAVGVVLTDLQPYQWTYDQILWHECRASTEFRNRKSPRHELLGSMIPGGDKLNRSWRNILQVKDVPWLEDHKLGENIVFPATAYAAMAIEALFQSIGRSFTEVDSVELRHFHILTALTLSTQNPGISVELFTSLQRQRLSATTKSKTWWSFEIVSYKDGISTIHATGTIRIQGNSKEVVQRLCLDEHVMGNTSTQRWYDKFIKEGLNFGPAFQSIEELQIPRRKRLQQAIAKVRFLQQGPGAVSKDSKYVVHPITMDAMLQTAIIASTSGLIQDLRAQIPVMIEHAVIKIPSVQAPFQDCSVYSAAESSGFSITTVSSELLDQKGQLCLQLHDVRLVAFAGSDNNESRPQRHPMLRVLWKPDILGFCLPSPQSLYTCLNPSRLQHNDNVIGIGTQYGPELLSALDLICHKNPRLRILVLGDQSGFARSCLTIARSKTAFPRYHSFAVGRLTDSETYEVKTLGKLSSFNDNDQFTKHKIEAAFDLVAVPEYDSLVGSSNVGIDAIQGLLAPSGILLAHSRLKDEHLSVCKGVSATHCALSSGEGRLILARRLPKTNLKDLSNSGIVIVERKPDSDLGNAIVKKFPHSRSPIKRIQLEDVSIQGCIPLRSIVIVTLEAEIALLSSIDSINMALLKVITDNASTILWITGGALLACKNPDVAPVSGLSRAIMVEQPSLKFLTLDLDGTSCPDMIANHVADIVTQAATGDVQDFEFVERKGVIHISRFVPDEVLNEKFRQRQGMQPVQMSLHEARGSRLFIENVGQFDTISFKQEIEETPLDSDYVEIEVKSVGLNAKDLYVLSGKTETKNSTCALEYAGVVQAVGNSVTAFYPGDRVVVMAPNYFKLLERAPQWACQKLRFDESFSTVSTLCVVYATALYGLHRCGRIQSGETILIHSGAGGVGLAAIQIARLAGAKVFVTVSTPEKRDYLVETFGLNPDQVFNSRDTSFLDHVLTATEGRGVDMVLNSLTGDLLHDSWRACAEFGRFIEIGKRDILDAGSLDMQPFSKNLTFVAFDLSGLFYQSNPAMQRIWSSLMKDVIDMYRDGQISVIEPLKVFDVSQMTQALWHFSSKDRMGKIAISLEDPDVRLKVLPFKYVTEFSPDKSYLLVGCLGGLGGTLAKWMATRGARKFVFLGRSGVDRPAARRLVEDLEGVDALVNVVRGDVSNLRDVQRAVDTIPGILGGVIQAAMGLSEALFTTMSSDSWHASIDPKLRGSWNLHNAIAKRESTQKLDFFLMTSSVSGSVGTATESNYCAANYFLDAFARYRKSRGLAAVSLGLGMISEVGYLHENPEIEALLLRKGIQAINEDELIQIVDLALSSQSEDQHEFFDDPLASSHILTGLEPLGLEELRKKGFEGTNMTLDDPRASILAGALERGTNDRSDGPKAATLPELSAALENEGSKKSLNDAVLGLMVKRFSDLTLTPLTKVNVIKPLAAYGMDSMLAAEFRTWIYRAFKTDVSFFGLLSGTVNLSSLARVVEGEVSRLL